MTCRVNVCTKASPGSTVHPSTFLFDARAVFPFAISFLSYVVSSFQDISDWELKTSFAFSFTTDGTASCKLAEYFPYPTNQSC